MVFELKATNMPSPPKQKKIQMIHRHIQAHLFEGRQCMLVQNSVLWADMGLAVWAEQRVGLLIHQGQLWGLSCYSFLTILLVESGAPAPVLSKIFLQELGLGTARGRSCLFLSLPCHSRSGPPCMLLWGLLPGEVAPRVWWLPGTNMVFLGGQGQSSVGTR